MSKKSRKKRRNRKIREQIIARRAAKRLLRDQCEVKWLALDEAILRASRKRMGQIFKSLKRRSYESIIHQEQTKKT
jgi:hypothetical protein